MAASSRRPDMRHEERLANLRRFMVREDGDTGTLHTDEGDTQFEVVRRESVPMPGYQTMTRLVCKNVANDELFNLDSTKAHVLHVDWD